MINWDMDADGIVTLTMDDPDQGANTMNATFQRSFRAAVDRLVAERDSITGVILTSGKKTFFAGGDLNLLSRTTPADAAELTAALVEFHAVHAQAGDPRQAGRRGDQRRRARRRPGDRAGLPPPGGAGRRAAARSDCPR